MGYAHVMSISAGSAGQAGPVSTSAINTTGADIIVVEVTAFSVIPSSVTDNKGNTYTALTESAGSPIVRKFVCINPIVGSGHTFTAALNGFPAIAVSAFSGVKSGETTADKQSAANAASPGSITPSENNELIVTGLVWYPGGTVSIDNGFTVGSQTDYQAGAHMGAAIAYKIQGTAAAINPAWSHSSGFTDRSSNIASFKAAPIFTASAAVIAAPATASGSATFTAAATYTASAAVTAGRATASGSATFTAPIYTGTAGGTSGAATASGSATRTTPSYTGTGAMTAGPATAIGAATFDAPVYTSTAAISAPAATAGGSATRTTPAYTAAANITLTGASASGIAQFATVVSLATATVTAPRASSQGFASVTAPTRTATAAAIVAAAIASGAAIDPTAELPPGPSWRSRISGGDGRRSRIQGMDALRSRIVGNDGRRTLIAGSDGTRSRIAGNDGRRTAIIGNEEGS